MFKEFLIEKWPRILRHQILENITLEWKKMASKILPTKIFSDVLPGQTDGHDDDPIKNAWKIFQTDLNQLIGGATKKTNSSFGLIQTSRKIYPNIPDLDIPNPHISLIIFCKKSETLKIQQMLTRARFSWYRKLSKSPLTSRFHSEQDSHFTISYKPKHLTEQFDLDHIMLDSHHDDPENFDVITCQSNLGNCLLAFLDDSYTQVSPTKTVMKLNPALVPFKIAVILETSNLEIRSKLSDVAEHLIDLLKEHQEMSVFPFDPHWTICADRCDEWGVKYCIILKEETLRNGVLYVRNRDTTLSEMVHISNLLKTLLFYLQPEKLLTLSSDTETKSRGKS